MYIDGKGPILKFDIVVDANIEFIATSGSDNYRDRYDNTICLKLECSGSLGQRFRDFKVLEIDEWTETTPRKPMDGDLIPIIRSEKYDDYAKEILSKYYPEALEQPMKIDGEELAKRMGHRIENAVITSSGRVFGAIFFEDTEIEVYDVTSGELVKRQVKKNDILIDDSAQYLCLRSITIAHECVHSYLHKEAYLFRQIIDSSIGYIQCQIDARNNSSSVEWMEKQANAIAPCIIMPKEQFISKAKELLANKGIIEYDYSNLIKDLADFFGASMYSVKKRLVDCGFYLAKGACNWVDGKYVRTHQFKKGSLAKDETYTISLKDMLKVQMSNKEYLTKASQEVVLFVENHVCINDVKYIEENDDGELILTDYALAHMDECCLKFVCTFKNGNTANESGVFSYLYRDASKEVEFDLTMINNPKVLDSNGIIRATKHNESVKEIQDNVRSVSFAEGLDFTMKFLSISNNELAMNTGLDEKTIRRYRNGENKEPNKKTVVAILLGLNIPFEISRILVKQSGLAFADKNEYDRMLIMTLTNFRGYGIRNVNSILKSLGHEPLTNKI